MPKCNRCHEEFECDKACGSNCHNDYCLPCRILEGQVYKILNEKLYWVESSSKFRPTTCFSFFDIRKIREKIIEKRISTPKT